MIQVLTLGGWPNQILSSSVNYLFQPELRDRGPLIQESTSVSLPLSSALNRMKIGHFKVRI